MCGFSVIKSHKKDHNIYRNHQRNLRVCCFVICGVDWIQCNGGLQIILFSLRAIWESSFLEMVVGLQLGVSNIGLCCIQNRFSSFMIIYNTRFSLDFPFLSHGVVDGSWPWKRASLLLRQVRSKTFVQEIDPSHPILHLFVRNNVWKSLE